MVAAIRLWDTKLRAALWATAFLTALLVSSLIPPIQSPDEDSHIGRAYLLSKGQFLLQAVPDDLVAPAGAVESQAALIERTRMHVGRAGGMVDTGLLGFIEMNLSIAHGATARLTPADLDRLSRIRWSGSEQYAFMPGTGYYFPAIYAPQALGIAVGRALDLSVAHTYELARVCTLLVCFAMLWLACELVTPNAFVSALWLLPMSLFQLLSPTLDGLTTSLAILTTSVFIYAISTRHERSDASSWGLALCVFLLAASKAHLLPLVTLPFYLAWQRHSRKDFFLGVAVAACAIAWTLFALHSTNDERLVREHGTSELLYYYGANPTAYFKMIVASLSDSDLVTFYQQTFIGIFGWLDARLPPVLYPILWTGLGLCALASIRISTLRQDWDVRLLLIVAALASVGLVFLAMLVTWTAHPAVTVQGVQGRYLIVPAILLGYALNGLAATPLTPIRWLGRGTLTVFALISLSGLMVTLLNRYH